MTWRTQATGARGGGEGRTEGWEELLEQGDSSIPSLSLEAKNMMLERSDRSMPTHHHTTNHASRARFARTLLLFSPLPHGRFLAGASAGSCAVVACYPLDLIRTRLTTQQPATPQSYRGISHAFFSIIKKEGGERGNNKGRG